jgi:COMPASS component SWD3
MTIQDQVQDLMQDVLGSAPSPKRRRLDSNSPPSFGRNDTNATNTTDDNQSTDTANGYAFEEESAADNSNSQTPRERDQPPTTTDSRLLGVNYQPHMTLKGHKRGVAAVRFSPNGKWIASCCEQCAPSP